MATAFATYPYFHQHPQTSQTTSQELSSPWNTDAGRYVHNYSNPCLPVFRDYQPEPLPQLALSMASSHQQQHDDSFGIFQSPADGYSPVSNAGSTYSPAASSSYSPEPLPHPLDSYSPYAAAAAVFEQPVLLVPTNRPTHQPRSFTGPPLARSSYAAASSSSSSPPHLGPMPLHIDTHFAPIAPPVLPTIPVLTPSIVPSMRQPVAEFTLPSPSSSLATTPSSGFPATPASAAGPAPQFAVLTSSGHTLAASDNYKDVLTAARTLQQADTHGPNGSDSSRVCKYCGKVCDRPSTLRTHLNSHTGARPHACPVEGCGRQFTVLSNMYRHAKSCAAQHKRAARGVGASSVSLKPSTHEPLPRQ